MSRVLVVGSGKGGVGKSTIAVNLAIALAQQGLNIGLLDADIYGPSIPIMLGLRKLTPRLEKQTDHTVKMIPFTKFGIQTMSIGFLMEEARSVIWRGPLLHSALNKMISETLWGNLDILIIDLPPGTGDCLLSLAQLLPLTGALVVTTPQEVAVLDAIKAINAFDQLDIPLMGVIENMAGFIVPETGQIYHVFGQGKAKELANRFNLPLLATIPLISDIRESGDEGKPVAFHQGHLLSNQLFVELAKQVHSLIQPLPNPFER